MNALWNSFETLLGLGVEPKNLTFIQISLRGIIVFLATLSMVRLGHKRSLSRKTPFDAVLLVILAVSAFARYQWLGGFLCHNRRRRGSSVAAPTLRPFGILFPSRSVFWLKASLTSSYATGNAIFA